MAVVFKPLHEVPPALHILYVSLYLTHPLQVLQSLMSWWVESGVIDEGDIQNVQGWGYSRTGLRTTAIWQQCTTMENGQKGSFSIKLWFSFQLKCTFLLEIDASNLNFHQNLPHTHTDTYTHAHTHTSLQSLKANSSSLSSHGRANTALFLLPFPWNTAVFIFWKE